MKQILILFVGVIYFSACSIQHYKQASEKYQNKEYKEAIAHYEKLGSIESKRYDVSRELAYSYYKMGEYDKAEKAYTTALVNFPNQNDLYYQMALVLKLNDKCAEGSSYLEQYLEREKALGKDIFISQDFCKLSNKSYELCDHEKLQFEQGSTYLNPVHFQGRLYFLTQLEGNQYDICSVRSSDNGDFKKVKGSINTEFTEGPFDFDISTGEMYLTRNKINLKPSFLKKKKQEIQLEIVKAHRTGNSWNIISAFEFNEDDYSVGHPTITHDGKFMVFVSNKEDALGETDLYVTEKLENGRWSTPTVLPAEINSAYKEITPCFSKDVDGKNYLLTFASNRPSTYGGLDLYTVSFDGKSWGKLLHPGFPINSSYNEYSLRYDHDNNNSLFVTDRENKHINDEAYTFTVNNRVTGVMLDENGNPIPEAKLKITNIQTKQVQEVSTNLRGSYEADINTGYEYKIEAITEGYEPTLVSLSSDKRIEPVIYELDVLVKAKKKLSSDQIVMNEIYFKYDKAELDEESSSDLIKLKNTLEKYPHLVITIIGHTDSRGSKRYNQQLSEKRAEAVVDWLISKGVTRHRLTYQGMGEDELINKCKDGVECSEEEHRENRRTTFKILSFRI